MQPLGDRPAEVDPLLYGGHVDLFEFALADISDVDEPVIEPEAPWVAESKIEEGRPGIAIDAKCHQAAEESIGVLAVAEPVIGPSPIAEAQEQQPIGTEQQHAAVVVAGGLVKTQEHPLAPRQDHGVG